MHVLLMLAGNNFTIIVVSSAKQSVNLWPEGTTYFAVAGPRVWNSLPTELRTLNCSVGTFVQRLKAFLFGCLRIFSILRYINVHITLHYITLHLSTCQTGCSTSLICQQNVEAGLRSSTSSLLDVRPSRCVTVGDRCFAAAGPRLWNSLPADVQSAPSLATFRQKLNIHLFPQSYPDTCSVAVSP